MKYTWVAILVGLWLELVDVVLARYAVTVPKGEEHPKFRVFQYGKRHTTEHHDRSFGPSRWEWFFILKLPSWDWQKGDYGRRWQWHQLCLVWTDTHGWMTWYEPAKD